MNESAIDPALKQAIESEVLDLFERKAFSQSFVATSPAKQDRVKLPPIESKPQSRGTAQNQNQSQSQNQNQKPELPNDSNPWVDKMESLSLREVPDEPQPRDLYNRIVQLNVNMQVEEDASKKKYKN